MDYESIGAKAGPIRDSRSSFCVQALSPICPATERLHSTHNMPARVKKTTKAQTTKPIVLPISIFDGSKTEVIECDQERRKHDKEHVRSRHRFV